MQVFHCVMSKNVFFGIFVAIALLTGTMMPGISGIPNVSIHSVQKISDLAGGFEAILNDGDFFGHAISVIGDLDGDGTQDLVVSSHQDDDGGKDRGAVYILFMNRDGTVKSFQKISDTEGGFEGILDDNDQFGHEINTLIDFDGNGVNELIIGAPYDNDGGKNRGAFSTYFL